MALDISKVYTLVENGTGFGGGSAYDSHTHLTLDETISGFSRDLSECAREMVEDDMKMNNSLMEAAMVGDVSAVDALVEASAGNIGDKIKAFFDRLLAWIKSIIAKLRVHIDKIFMSGKKLYAKYHKSEAYERGDFDGLVVKGYKFAKVESIITEPTAELLSEGITTVSSAFTDLKAENIQALLDNENESEVDKIKEAITDTTVAERKNKLFSKYASCVDDGDEGKEVEAINKALKSDKTEADDIKYGNDNFTKEWIKDTLDNDKSMKDLLAGYVAIEKDLEKSKKVYTTAAAKSGRDNKRVLRDNKDSAKFKVTGFNHELNRSSQGTHAKSDEGKEAMKIQDDQAGKNLRTIEANNAAALSVATTLIDEIIAVNNTVKQCRKTYEDAKIAQAKKFFGAMLTYKKPKTANEAYENYEMMATLAEI